jgi:hypothetical protein
MLSSRQRNRFGPWEPVASIAGTIVALGVVIGWPQRPPVADSAALAAQRSDPDRCALRAEVSSFVCRNTWLASLRR